MRRIMLFLLVLSLLMVSGAAYAAEGTVTIGSKDFTEQYILSDIMRILLEDRGFKVNTNYDMGTMVARQALEHGQIDLYMEYTGTALMTFMKSEEVITDPQEVYDIVSRWDLEEHELVWLNIAEFNNTYTLMMQKEEASKLGIKSISDLAEYVNENPQDIKFATNAEFYSRPDGFPALEKAYDFNFPDDKIVKLDSGLVYTALKEGQVDVSMGFATDGRIAGFNLVNLVDDKQFFPVYNPAPVVRKEALEEYPEIEGILNEIGPSLDTATMTRLNYLVDIEHLEVEDVARNWLEGVGLIY